MLPEIVFLTSYPPQECGIATFSQDLVTALSNQFRHSFELKIAALQPNEPFRYPAEVGYSLDTTKAQSYEHLAQLLNFRDNVGLVVVQHEFGLYHEQEEAFLQFLADLTKPVMVVFHTVLPNPDAALRQRVERITQHCAGIIAMTENAKQLLVDAYGTTAETVTVIEHGTHLVRHQDKDQLKAQYNLTGKKVLSTFGLISSGKNIEATLKALPAIVAKNPETVFLVIGKTHPVVLQREGEAYRESLEELVRDLGMEDHVQFVNSYVSLPTLLEYLQLTDLYLFTSKDPNQAVSGTFSYALSCGCPVVSTPIPHAIEVLQDNMGRIVPFNHAEKLAVAVNELLADEQLMAQLRSNILHRMATTSWENVAIHYAQEFKKHSAQPIVLEYRLPEINLQQLEKMTTDFGIIQFSQLGQPDLDSGYTLDDNARALIAMCQHFELTRNNDDLKAIRKYLAFIDFCLDKHGYFLNYVDEDKHFTDQNFSTNLSDSNGRAVWALGYLISLKRDLPEDLVTRAETMFRSVLKLVSGMHSTRAMAFALKGLYYYNRSNPMSDAPALITLLANRMVQMYRHEASEDWKWFESYLTYANSLLPEALLCAYEVTNNIIYRDIALATLDFLLTHTFHDYGIKVISNRGWMHRGEVPQHYGEQPIDVAYTVITLSRFYEFFKDDAYLRRMETAFNWFLGQNHLNRMIYNPCTGGSWDGLEEKHVNLNQGAESTVSYLMARFTIELHKGALLQLHAAAQEERTLGPRLPRKRALRRSTNLIQQARRA